MGTYSSIGANSGHKFESALAIKKRRENATTLQVSDSNFNELLWGLEPGLFYLFYSSDGGKLADLILYKLIVEAISYLNQRVFYLICGNYRRSRTVLDSECLLSMLEEKEVDISDVLSRIFVTCAFSEQQQIHAASLIEDVVTGEKSFNLIALQQITKIFYGKTALKFENPSHFSGMISRMKRICCDQGIILTATCRSAEDEKPVHLPEGGSYLRHTANVIIYLREHKKGDISAYVVKHPDRKQTGKIVRSKGEIPWEE